MNYTTKIQKDLTEQIVISLNPKSTHFNFEFWAKEVRHQMLTALQQRSSSRKKVAVK